MADGVVGRSLASCGRDPGFAFAGDSGHNARMPPIPPQPLCLALVLCDGVHRDPDTRKLTLLGLIQQVDAAELPLRRPLAVYFALAGGRGERQVTLRISDSYRHHPIETLKASVVFSDPLEVVEGFLSVHVEFTAPGVYHVELAVEGEVLASRRLRVLDGSRND